MPIESHTQEMSVMEGLFRKFYRSLRAYAYRFVSDRNVAEDVVQDVFFELWTHRDTIRFEDEKSVKAYLFKSVYNRCLNLIHSVGRHEQTSLENMPEELIDNAILFHISHQEQALLVEELENEIRGFIETLSPQCKNVFLLSRKHELKNKEIAEQLGISVKAVEKHISKALAGLRSHLQKKDLFFLLF